MQNEDTPTEDKSKTQKLATNLKEYISRKPITSLILGFGIVVTLLLGFISLPTIIPALHGLIYGIIFSNPGMLQWTVIGVILIIAARRVINEEKVVFGDFKLRGIVLTLGVIFVLFGVFVSPFIGGAYALIDMGNEVNQTATEIDTLPETSTENVRILPRSVANSYTQSAIQTPQFAPTDSDIAYINGSYKWSYGLTPDNLYVQLFGKQKGALYVDMTKVDKDVTIKNTEYSIGRDQGVLDSYAIRNVINEPLSLHKFRTTFNSNPSPESRPYIAHSLIQYDLKFRLLPIPQVYSTPKFGGVKITHPNGEMKTIPTEEVGDNKLLNKQNVYPYSLTNYKVRSTKYANGFINRWFRKQGVLEVASLPDRSNDWPLTVPTENTENGLTYFVAAEPADRGSGIFQIWTVDSQTGTMSVQEYDDGQIGPTKAVNFVGRQPQVNRLSDASVVAPVPIVNDNTLYWHTKVIPNKQSGVIYTGFVNAESGDVTLVEGTDEAYRFINEDAEIKSTPENNQTENNPTNKNTSNVRLIVTNDNGEIVNSEEVQIPDDGNVTIDIES